MSTEQKRAAIQKVYPNWTVVKTMPETQVHVVYMRLLNARKL